MVVDEFVQTMRSMVFTGGEGTSGKGEAGKARRGVREAESRILWTGGYVSVTVGGWLEPKLWHVCCRWHSSRRIWRSGRLERPNARSKPWVRTVSGCFPRMVSWYARWITLRHGCAELKEAGNGCFQRRQYEDAISKYKKALQILPFEAPLLTNLAQVVFWAPVSGGSAFQSLYKYVVLEGVVVWLSFPTGVLETVCV